MRTVSVLLFLALLISPEGALAGSSTTYFAEFGGTFSLKSDSRVLDDRGGVLRVGAVSAPLGLMAGVVGRGAHVEASGGDAYSLGNVGVFGGFAFFQDSPVRLRLFLPWSFGRIKPAGGAASPADDSVWFFEPEAQVSYRFVDRVSFGIGLNHRFVFSYDGDPAQNEFIEKLMFTGAFSYEF